MRIVLSKRYTFPKLRAGADRFAAMASSRRKAVQA
jgi:hypothetical protein